MQLRSIRLADRLVAAACALGLLVAAFAEGSGRAHPALAVLIASATGLAILWRRVQPLPSLIAAMACVTAAAAALETANGSVAVAVLPLYTVAALGGRRRSLAVGVGTTVLLVLATALIAHRIMLSEGAIRLLVLLGAIAVGEIVRSRRALNAAAALRLQQQAHERESEHERRLSEERLRLAREVHDSIAHALVAINVQAGVAAHLGAAADSQAALAAIKAVSAEALADLRATLGLLRQPGDRPPDEPALGLDALPQLLERTRGAGLDAHADLDGIGATIPSPVGQAGFRIVQESLTNVLRHADATSANVRVRVQNGALEIEVENDGRSESPAVAGLGLRGMAERADALGGRLIAGPRSGGGWRVHARLPLTGDRP